jgi:predicted dehydrogenase
MTLKIGMIGAAGHVNYVTAGIQELGDARLCAVAAGCAEEDVASVAARMKAGEDVARYADYRELLAQEDLDIVGISPYYYLHAEISAASLEAGMAVFCEKPVSLDLPGLARVREARERSGRPLGMMLAFRYDPVFATARRLVAEGAIGSPTVAYGQKSYKRGNRPEFYRKRETFGGIIPWVGIHALDWVRWVSGCDYRRACAHHTKLHRPDYPGMEDAAGVTMVMDNGGTAVMSFDFLRPAGAPTHGDDRLRLLGERGALEIIGNRLQLITETGVENIDVPANGPGCFADFARSVADPSQNTCRISSGDVLRVTEIALKTRMSADLEQWVDLSPE